MKKENGEEDELLDREKKVMAGRIGLMVSFLMFGLTRLLSAQEAVQTELPQVRAAREAGIPVPRPLNAEWKHKIDGIRRLTERVRGLKFKDEIYCGMQTEAEMIQSVQAEFDSDLPPEKLRNFVDLIALLGGWRWDFDLKKTYQEMMAGSAGGYYNPSQKWLVVVQRNDSVSKLLELLADQSEITFSHELTHALQDQHYGLKRLQGDGLGDAATAVTMLAEGDATWTMYDYDQQKTGRIPLRRTPDNARALEKQLHMLDVDFDPENPAVEMMPGMKELARAPRMMRESLLLLYPIGFSLVFRIQTDSTSRYSMDWAWRHPPASTEQCLHPEKYLTDKPDLPKIFPPDFQPLPKAIRAELGTVRVRMSLDLGELRIRSLLRDYRPRAQAAFAAEGWDGDRAYLLDSRSGDSSPALLFVSEWDTEDDAAVFAGNVLEMLKKRISRDVNIASREISGNRIPVAIWNARRKSAFLHSAILSRSHSRVVLLLNVPEQRANVWIRAALSLPTTEATAQPDRSPDKLPANP